MYKLLPTFCIISSVFILLLTQCKTSLAIKLQCKNIYDRFDVCRIDPIPGNFSRYEVDIVCPTSTTDIKTIEIFDVDLGRLPNSLLNYPRLIHLDCWNCYIHSLNGTEKFQRIETLSLYGSPLIEVELGQLRNPNLVYLSLKNNKIKWIEESSFSQIPKLRELDLSYNEIQYLPGGIFRNNLENLEVIKLSGNLIQQIEGVFDNLVALRDLDLSYNKITRISTHTFEDSYAIREIILNENQIYLVEPNSFKSQINLCWLSLSGNRLRFINVDIAKHCQFNLILRKNMLEHISITTEPDQPLSLNIDVSHNKLESFVFPDDIQFKSIELSHNRIKHLSANLVELEELNFANNNITNEIVGTILDSAKNISRLYLNGTGIDRRQFLQLVQLPKLRILDASHNLRLKNLNFIAIDPPSKSLIILYLRFCGIEQINIDLLREKFPRLGKIGLRGNPINYEEFKRLRDMLLREYSRLRLVWYD